MRRRLALVAGFLAAAIVFALLWSGPPRVRVGLLYAQEGSLSAVEPPVLEATLFAIEEVNRYGGVMGFVIDPDRTEFGSAPGDYVQQAQALLDDGVTTLFGGGPGAARRAIAPQVEAADGLLFYPHLYEGLEESEHIVHVGATANQRIVPAVKWARLRFGPRVSLIGMPGVYSRATHAQIRDELARTRGTVVSEAFIPFEPGPDDAARAVAALQPGDVLVNTTAGAAQTQLLGALQAAGVTTPMLSFAAAARDLRDGGPWRAGDHYLAGSYFEGMLVPENKDFLGAWRAEHPEITVTEPMVAAYTAVHLWAAAVREAGSFDPAKVREALPGLAVSSPRGVDYIDPDNLHVWQNLRVARVEADGRLEEVWLEPSPVPAVPWPEARPRDAWEAVLRGDAD